MGFLAVENCISVPFSGVPCIFEMAECVRRRGVDGRMVARGEAFAREGGVRGVGG